MEKNNYNKNLQDSFFYDLIKNNEVAEFHLTNGLIITGKLIKFDNFSILVDYNNKKTLIFKHSISYIYSKKIKKNKK